MQIQQRRRNPRRAGKKIWEKSLSNLVSLQAKLQGPQLAVIARSAANLQPRSSRMGSPNAYRYWYMRDGEQAELRPSILCSPTCSPIKGGSRTAIRRRFNAIDCLLRWFGTRRSVVQIHSPRPLPINPTPYRRQKSKRPPGRAPSGKTMGRYSKGTKILQLEKVAHVATCQNLSNNLRSVSATKCHSDLPS